MPIHPAPARAARLARVPVPAEFTTLDDDSRRYGGDVRLGDLTGNGVADLVVFRSLGGMKPAFLGAFDLDGTPLWSLGNPALSVDDRDSDTPLRTIGPDRPGPVTVADVDGDGVDEVICLFVDEGIGATSKWDLSSMRLLLLDGRTGAIRREARPAELLACDGRVDGELLVPNYVHQRLLVADLSGAGIARDIVLKVGRTVLALSHEFDVLWTYENRWNRYPSHAAYIPAVGDLDGDGRDEVNGGLFLLDHDGAVLWEEFVGDNMDSVLVEPWDRPSPARAFGSAGAIVLDEAGRRHFELGLDEVPHGQEIRCGRFDAGDAGAAQRQIAVRYNGHTPHLLVADEGGVRSRFTVDESPNNTGLETIHWHGEAGPDLIYTPTALWSGDGARAVELPDLPPPSGGKMGWYHCIPAPLCGDGRDDLVLYDPWQDAVHIYGAAGRSFGGYRTTRRQANARIID